MNIMVLMFVFLGIFAIVLLYGIWHDIKVLNKLERLKAEREARKYGNMNMTPVV